MWLLIRVYLQLAFQRAGISEGYKRFIACFMAHILNIARQNTLSSPVLYSMSAKISQRLVKLGTPLPLHLLNPLREILKEASETLQGRWISAQSLEGCLDTAGLQSLSLDEDSMISLPELEIHLNLMTKRRSKDRNTTFFPSGSLFESEPFSWPYLPTSFTSYDAANLNAFETWVETYLRKCMDAHNVNDACQEAYKLMKRYHALASTIYADNPENLSTMVLTMMEIWVCCDQRAISACEWLAEYDPGVPLDLFQNLLLPSRLQMKRLLDVERYLSTRAGMSKMLSKALMCGEAADRHCFAARYFDCDEYYQNLMERIDMISEIFKASKLCELADLKEKRNELKQRSEKESHGERVVVQRDRYDRPISSTKVHDDANCVKCILLDKANGISI